MQSFPLLCASIWLRVQSRVTLSNNVFYIVSVVIRRLSFESLQKQFNITQSRNNKNDASMNGTRNGIDLEL